MDEQYYVPPTDAEIDAEGDALIKWTRGMPRPEPKRKPTPQLSLADIDARIVAERAFMHDVMAAVVAEVQHRFKQKLYAIEQRLKDLETALEVERQITIRMARIEQRELKERHVNGHA